MNLKEFLAIQPVTRDSGGYTFQGLRPQIICEDGVFLSVQASDTHYCTPRVNSISYYDSVEVGYPSIRPPKEWEEYFDGVWQKNWFERVWRNRDSIFYQLKKIARRLLGRPNEFDGTLRMTWWYLRHLMDLGDNATNGVYGYIPTYLVEEFVEAHGGINVEKTFKEREK